MTEATARRRYEQDPRFNAMVNAVALQACAPNGGTIDERTLEVARRAASLMLDKVYEEDAELKALVIEVELHKELLFRHLSNAPLTAVPLDKIGTPAVTQELEP